MNEKFSLCSQLIQDGDINLRWRQKLEKVIFTCEIKGCYYLDRFDYR